MQVPFLTPLTPDQIANAGVPGRWSFGYSDIVRFSEIDALNHVNNGAYVGWFETARVRYFRAWGLKNDDAADPQTVVRQQSIDYLSPLFVNAPYIIATRTVAYRRTSFTMEYVCYADGVKATGSSVMVTLENDGVTKRVLPGDLLSKFQEIDGAAKA